MQELEFSDSIQIEISCPLLIVSELQGVYTQNLMFLTLIRPSKVHF